MSDVPLVWVAKICMLGDDIIIGSKLLPNQKSEYDATSVDSKIDISEEDKVKEKFVKIDTSTTVLIDFLSDEEVSKTNGKSLRDMVVPQSSEIKLPSYNVMLAKLAKEIKAPLTILFNQIYLKLNDSTDVALFLAISYASSKFDPDAAKDVLPESNKKSNSEAFNLENINQIMSTLTSSTLTSAYDSLTVFANTATFERDVYVSALKYAKKIMNARSSEDLSISAAISNVKLSEFQSQVRKDKKIPDMEIVIVSDYDMNNDSDANGVSKDVKMVKLHKYAIVIPESNGLSYFADKYKNKFIDIRELEQAFSSEDKKELAVLETQALEDGAWKMYDNKYHELLKEASSRLLDDDKKGRILLVHSSEDAKVLGKKIISTIRYKDFNVVLNFLKAKDANVSERKKERVKSSYDSTAAVKDIQQVDSPTQFEDVLIRAYDAVNSDGNTE